MRFYFSTDHVRNSIVTNDHAQVIYKIDTPFKFLWQKGISTIWKIAPNSEPISFGQGINSADAEELDPDPRDDEAFLETDAAGDDAKIRSPSQEPDDQEGHASDGEELARSATEEFDMQDRFVKLATVEWRHINSTTIKWLGANGLGTSEVATKDLLKSITWTNRRRVFTGCDGRTYEWELAFHICKLYLIDGVQKTCIARYHRYKSVLVHGKDSRSGYLEFDDEELTKAFGQPHISSDLLDMLLVTFLYVEKRRRDKERAAKRDIRWNF